ncbi:olfactory receptor 867-like [Onychomys torridus]|uniref:olfactory receptor 867-like n=1 Tax=Onychomys torridus TaxID=38674 RepID=UPI00167F9F1D|nr:olfactory receptor 867-like [Onychomys torridus]
MEAKNYTSMQQFFLTGLSEDPEMQFVLFGLFMSMFLVTVLGNLLIMLVTSCDSHCHTPMYFFLCNLSFVDICLTSTTITKMLVNIYMHTMEISYTECLTQVYFLNNFLGMDNFLLTIMAYDYFVAICHPLNYTIIMNPRICGLLVLLSWITMFWVSLIHMLLMKQPKFSISTEIPHFFCELTELLRVAYSDTHINNIFLYLVTALLGVFPVIGIAFSYFHIVSALLKMSSIGNKYKAFSTCGSHLCVVSLFYGTGFMVHLSSAVAHSSKRNAITSIMYTVVTPMLNPIQCQLVSPDLESYIFK